MKISYKLPLSFLAVSLLVLAVGYAALRLSRQVMEQTLGRQSVLLANHLLDKADRHVYSRIEVFREFTMRSDLRKKLAVSNHDFEKLQDVEAYIDEKDREWRSAPASTMTPFMKALINTDLSEELREKQRFYEGQYGFKVIGEIFLTNRFGANVAQTGRTSDYRQNDEKWWQVAKEKGLYVGDVEYDESAGVHSLDIGIRVGDDGAKCLGVAKVVLNIQDVIAMLTEDAAAAGYKTMEFELLTAGGKVILASGGHRRFHDTSNAYGLAMDAKSQYFVASGDMPDQGKELFAVARSRGWRDYAGMGWVLIVELATEEVLAPAASLRSQLWIISACSVLAALLFGLAISRSICSPLGVLAGFARRFGQHRQAERLDFAGNNEISHLGRTFEKMTEDLLGTTVSRDQLAEEVEQRRRAEQIASEQAARFHELFSNMSSGVAIYQPSPDGQDFIFAEINHATEKIDGVKREDVVGRPVTDVFPGVEQMGMLAVLRRVNATGKPEHLPASEYRDGRIAGWRENYVYKLPSGEVVAVCDDVTERVEKEQALRVSEERYRILFESSRDAIMTLAPPSWRFTSGNKAAVQMFKTGGEAEFVALGPWQVSPEFQPDGRPSAEKAKQMIETAMRNGSHFFEWMHCRLEGEAFPATVLLTRIEVGGKVQLQATVRDISERKRAEAELHVAQQHLLEASRLAGMTEVATGVLHNIGNVLNSVNVAADLVANRIRNSKADRVAKLVDLIRPHRAELGQFLTQDPKGKQIPDYLEQLAGRLGDERREVLTEIEGLVGKIEHIKGIVAMQQTFARSSGVSQETDVEELIADSLSINQSALDRHQVEARIECSVLQPIRVDRHKVLQILINLIRNAKHAMDDRPEISSRLLVRASQNGDNRVRIAVIDNGVGISEENLIRIFAHGFTTRADGHGFGLHSASLAAKDLGGSLLAESEGVNQGATFTLEIPVKPARADDE